MTTLGADTDNVVGRPTSPQTVTAPSQVERNKGPNERATQKSARTEGNNGPKLRSSCKSCASSSMYTHGLWGLTETTWFPRRYSFTLRYLSRHLAMLVPLLTTSRSEMQQGETDMFTLRG